MKKIILLLLLPLFTALSAQGYWTPTSSTAKNGDGSKYYTLNIAALHTQLNGSATSKAKTVIEIPALDGKMERYEVTSFPVVDPELALKYQLGSYTGI